jgi:hypothetical protein
MTATYLTRAQWGAGPLGAGHVVPLERIVGLVVHHTVIVMADYDHDGMIAGDLEDAIVYMRALQRARPDLGAEVPYSFVVLEGAAELDCIVAEGRGLGITGAHTIGYNSTRYGVAYAGDFTARAPTAGMLAGVRWVGRQLERPDIARPTFGHRDVHATACPGDAAYPQLPQLQPPFHDPDHQEEEPVVFIAEFLDWKDKRWLVEVTPRVAGQFGTRQLIPDPAHLDQLVAAGVRNIAAPIPGGNTFHEIK